MARLHPYAHLLSATFDTIPSTLKVDEIFFCEISVLICVTEGFRQLQFSLVLNVFDMYVYVHREFLRRRPTSEFTHPTLHNGQNAAIPEFHMYLVL